MAEGSPLFGGQVTSCLPGSSLTDILNTEKALGTRLFPVSIILLPSWCYISNVAISQSGEQVPANHHLAGKYARTFVRGHYLFQTVFLEARGSFKKQIKSVDKYPCIFLEPNGDYCVYYPLNIFTQGLSVWEILAKMSNSKHSVLAHANVKCKVCKLITWLKNIIGYSQVFLLHRVTCFHQLRARKNNYWWITIHVYNVFLNATKCMLTAHNWGRHKPIGDLGTLSIRRLSLQLFNSFLINSISKYWKSISKENISIHNAEDKI